MKNTVVYHYLVVEKLKKLVEARELSFDISGSRTSESTFLIDTPQDRESFNTAEEAIAFLEGYAYSKEHITSKK